jgi:type 1 glutamine amidotransferase
MSQDSFRVLAFHSSEAQGAEGDHVLFAATALAFFRDRAAREGFTLDVTADWNDLDAAKLAPYRVVMWVNHFPRTAAQREGFEKYMEGGGGWLGLHIAGYNDKDTKWPWFLRFYGDAVFCTNNWPIKPAKLVVDDRDHPVTRRLPASFVSPANEWYLWKPSPRLNKDVKVLVTLDPSNYPLGTKDILTEGDLPVVWTNTRYRMLYMNMGHGRDIFTSKDQNRLIGDGLLWLGRGGSPAP